MKKSVLQGACLAAILSLFSVPAFSQENAGIVNSESSVEEQEFELEADDYFDDLFNDTEDVDPIITEPVNISSNSDNKRGIVWVGDLESKLGGYIWFHPRSQEPGAVFNNKLGFMSNTSDGWFHMEGSLLVQFPKMQVGLYELFFNYMPYQRFTISAGKRDVQWGFSSLMDTNILDDKSNRKLEAEEVIQKKDRTVDDSKFTVMVTVPFPPYITVTGLAFYENYTNLSYYETWNVSPNDLSYCGKLETKIGFVAFNVFGRSWAYHDQYQLDPALGFELEATPVDSDLVKSNFYSQGVFHFGTDPSDPKLSRAKATVGYAQYVKDPWRVGARFEYQYIFIDDDKKDTESRLRHEHYFASELAWKHFLGDTGIDMGVACKVFHDFAEEYGTIVPGVQFDNFMRYASFKIGLPVYYGTINKVGLVAELTLKVKY